MDIFSTKNEVKQAESTAKSSADEKVVANNPTSKVTQSAKAAIFLFLFFILNSPFYPDLLFKKDMIITNQNIILNHEIPVDTIISKFHGQVDNI